MRAVNHQRSLCCSSCNAEHRVRTHIVVQLSPYRRESLSPTASKETIHDVFFNSLTYKDVAQ
jgi:hypothetical protein